MRFGGGTVINGPAFQSKARPHAAPFPCIEGVFPIPPTRASQARLLLSRGPALARRVHSPVPIPTANPRTLLRRQPTAAMRYPSRAPLPPFLLSVFPLLFRGLVASVEWPSRWVFISEALGDGWIGIWDLSSHL